MVVLMPKTCVVSDILPNTIYGLLLMPHKNEKALTEVKNIVKLAIKSAQFDSFLDL
jgi:hypothetical protein